ncbi:cytochrome c oxidase maturation protein [Candidatus Photodesmus katoptron]|nr:cbb3-type cytochrome oxidase assembly protein CcoS [Candidatus Photodesmus katoptron]KEY90694.1 cytochrome c oxidase maturation protein [Candidatus Photodesmus katoptron]
MESLYILIPIGIILIYLAMIIFFWAVKTGQFEDLDQEGCKILFLDENNN